MRELHGDAVRVALGPREVTLLSHPDSATGSAAARRSRAGGHAAFEARLAGSNFALSVAAHANLLGMMELVSLPFSPWSEKARWALDHHGVAYKSTTYRPLVGEPWLRVRQRRLTGRVSVPVLFDGSDAYPDSFSIALYAERVGRGSSLFPLPHRRRIEEIDELTERGLESGRALTLRRMLASKEALREMLPKPLRRFDTVGLRLAAFGIRRALRKYGAPLSGGDARAGLASVLDAIRASLEANEAPQERFVCGEFTYADICAAQVLQFVSPVRSVSFRIGRASRACLEDPALAAAYPDLLSWRDALYVGRRVGRAAS